MTATSVYNTKCICFDWSPLKSSYKALLQGTQLGEILQTIVIAIAQPNGPKYLKCKCGIVQTPVCYNSEPNTIQDALETKVNTIYHTSSGHFLDPESVW